MGIESADRNAQPICESLQKVMPFPYGMGGGDGPVGGSRRHIMSLMECEEKRLGTLRTDALRGAALYRPGTDLCARVAHAEKIIREQGELLEAAANEIDRLRSELSLPR